MIINKENLVKQGFATNGIFEDFIGIWDKTINQNTCNEFIEYYDWIVKHHYNYYSNENQIYGISKAEGQEDESVFLNASSPQYPDPLCEKYWKSLNNCLKEYIKKYKISVSGDLHSWLFKVHRVKEKQGYHVWHCENPVYEVRDRFLAYMTYIQAPQEGGETEFLFQSKRIEPVVGRTLIWPAGFTHIHRGLPPLDGEKMYITGWFNMSPSFYPPGTGRTI